MKTRYLYVLIYGVPALLAAMVASSLLFGAAAGFLWLYVFGDQPWPASVGITLTAGLILVCVALWAILIWIAYLAGKKREARGPLSVRHVVAALGMTVLLVLLVVLYQWHVGNIGAKSASALCAAFCLDKGFSASSLPPRDSGVETCSCLDERGRATVTVPMSKIRSGQSQ